MTTPTGTEDEPMATAITVGAAAGAYMDTVVVLEWRAAPGDAVRKGQVVAVVETAKAATEVEAPRDGVLSAILADVGAEIAIASPLGLIGDDADATETTKATTIQPAEDATPTVRADVPLSGSGGAGTDRIIASPAARRHAETVGLDLQAVVGTGPGGRIKVRDVTAALRGRDEVLSGLDPCPRPEFRPAAVTEAACPLAVTRSGPDTGTPILLLHGFAGDATAWHAIERRLSRTHPVLRMDLPCHGRSPRQRFRSFRDFVRPVLDAADALEAGPMHVVGHSLGGAVALALAERRPDLVRSLALLSPVGLGTEIDGHVLDGLCRAARPESLTPWLRRLVVDPACISDAYARAAMVAREDPDLRAAQRALAASLFPDGTQSINVTPLLRRVTMPIRLVWGRADELVPWRHALAAPGRVALHLLPAVGHLPHLEVPDTVAQIIRDMIVCAGSGDPAVDGGGFPQEARCA
jgi:pyruvate dehydrogenase E2 component (dihydrolipoamide acetyltransferase)